jgi:hypothetical protein
MHNVYVHFHDFSFDYGEDDVSQTAFINPFSETQLDFLDEIIDRSEPGEIRFESVENSKETADTAFFILEHCEMLEKPIIGDLSLFFSTTVHLDEIIDIRVEIFELNAQYPHIFLDDEKHGSSLLSGECLVDLVDMLCEHFGDFISCEAENVPDRLFGCRTLSVLRVGFVPLDFHVV